MERQCGRGNGPRPITACMHTCGLTQHPTLSGVCTRCVLLKTHNPAHPGLIRHTRLTLYILYSCASSSMTSRTGLGLRLGRPRLSGDVLWRSASRRPSSRPALSLPLLRLRLRLRPRCRSSLVEAPPWEAWRSRRRAASPSAMISCSMAFTRSRESGRARAEPRGPEGRDVPGCTDLLGSSFWMMVHSLSGRPSGSSAPCALRATWNARASGWPRLVSMMNSERVLSPMPRWFSSSDIGLGELGLRMHCLFGYCTTQELCRGANGLKRNRLAAIEHMSTHL